MEKIKQTILWIIAWTLIQPFEIFGHYIKVLICGIIDIWKEGD